MDDFSQHRLISQHAGTPQVAAGAMLVQELMSHDIPSTLTVNNYFGVLQAVLNHLGIGVLPDYMTEDFPHLVRVLPDVESQRSAGVSGLSRRAAPFQAGGGLPRFRDRRDLRPIRSVSRTERRSD